MAYPIAYTSSVAIPLPSEQAVRQIMGKSYDPERTLNVLKMFAGKIPFAWNIAWTMPIVASYRTVGTPRADLVQDIALVVAILRVASQRGNG
jgi:hypothetical protein